MTESPLPELRASDADRERAADRLRRAAGDGQLTLEELEGRLHDAYDARTRAELERLTGDLQEPNEEGEAPARTAGYSVRPGEGGARWLVAIMGGCERKGRWRIGARCTAINIMGGSDLDLNQVEFAGERVELSVYSIMGGSEIHVPEGLAVEISDYAFMGGNSIDVPQTGTTSGGPVLHLRLFSLMGGTDVKRGPKLTRAQRKVLKAGRDGQLGR